MLIICILLETVLFALCSSIETSSYIAATIEHVVHWRKSTTSVSDAREIMYENIATLMPYIAEAKEEGADFVVLPEFGLTDLHPEGRLNMRYYLETLPDDDAGVNACDDEGYEETNPILYNMSCLAKQHNMTIIFNWGDVFNCTEEDSSESEEDSTECEDEDGYTQYNTQLVLSSEGELIAKYWKLHTFQEPEYNTPEQEEAQDKWFEDYKTFELNGITFGLIVCYDAIYSYPFIPLMKYHNVSNFIISHWWGNWFPYMPVTSWFQGLSKRYGINFIVSAGTHNGTWAGTWWKPSVSSGSGIYSKGDVIEQYYNSENDDSPKLLVGEVDCRAPLDQSQVELDYMGDGISDTDTIDATTWENVAYSYSLYLSSTNTEGTLTATLDAIGDDVDEFNCTAYYDVASYVNDYTYLLLFIASGWYYVPDGDDIYFYENFCSIAVCENYQCSTSETTSNVIFNKLTINAECEEETFQIPMVTAGDGEGIEEFNQYVSADWNYETGEFQLDVENYNKSLLSIGVTARRFNKDVRCSGDDCFGEGVGPSSSVLLDDYPINQLKHGGAQLVKHLDHVIGKSEQMEISYGAVTICTLIVFSFIGLVASKCTRDKNEQYIPL